MSAILGIRTRTPWTQAGTVLALLVLATLLLYRDTAAAMVDIWSRSDTFAHCFLVLPISAWLLWLRRADITAQPPEPMPWLLLPIAGAGLLWLLADLARVNAVTQLMLVSLIVLLVPALVGWSATRTMLFPLGFLFFAVPIGEFTTPWLMERTADFTVAALVATGIPVYREGMQFIIPSGSWSVVEACSGVRYLIASLMVGALFAYLNYRSMRRRWMFMGVALVVPILANWLRAYFIVLLAHYSGNELAVGADHLVYGWVFFGVVIVLMFMIGARWSEPDALPVVALPAINLPPPAARSAWTMPVATALALALPVLTLQALLAQESHAPPTLGEPVLSASKWSPSDRPAPWTPAFENPATQVQKHYAAEGAEPAYVGLYLGYFRQQNGSSKLVSSNNQLVHSTDKQWAQADVGAQRLTLTSGRDIVVRTAHLRPVIGSADETRLRVWQLYWVNGTTTSSDILGKLYGALHRLMGRGDDGAVVIVYAAMPPAVASAASADALLEAFMRDNFGAIEAVLQRTRDGS